LILEDNNTEYSYDAVRELNLYTKIVYAQQTRAHEWVTIFISLSSGKWKYYHYELQRNTPRAYNNVLKRSNQMSDL